MRKMLGVVNESQFRFLFIMIEEPARNWSALKCAALHPEKVARKSRTSSCIKNQIYVLYFLILLVSKGESVYTPVLASLFAEIRPETLDLLSPLEAANSILPKKISSLLECSWKTAHFATMNS
jgi:hypothetical protein